MRAANAFVSEKCSGEIGPRIQHIKVQLFGSLSATGRGHGTVNAIVLGLLGEVPELVNPEASSKLDQLTTAIELTIAPDSSIDFSIKDDITFEQTQLDLHPNALTFSAFDSDNALITSATYYSVGGGFVYEEQELKSQLLNPKIQDDETPFIFNDADELLHICELYDMTISEVMLANELALHSEQFLGTQLSQIWETMKSCVRNGCESVQETLPGKLNVPRRAPKLFKKLDSATSSSDSVDALDWVNLFALAVNEENAAGGRIVTAPTNGAAGIIPAVLHYYAKFVPYADLSGVFDFLLTAGAIGIIIKTNASISGAEVGCQGEVGSASAMAAAGLCALLGGTPQQIENAAEIALEHSLGLTCDPIGGLVQIPCIERNAIASNKAINAAKMALHGDGSHIVSLDQAIWTMRETGADMMLKYKETSLGGLAVALVEC